MKIPRYLIVGAALVATCAFAQGTPPGPPPATDYTFDFSPFIAEVDSNGNGLISLQEWQASGVCDSIFSMLHGSAEGEMTVEELTARMPQKEADQNGDGKIDVSEMTWVCNAGPGGPPPEGGPPPPGDAPSPSGGK